MPGDGSENKKETASVASEPKAPSKAESTKKTFADIYVQTDPEPEPKPESKPEPASNDSAPPAEPSKTPSDDESPHKYRAAIEIYFGASWLLNALQLIPAAITHVFVAKTNKYEANTYENRYFFYGNYVFVILATVVQAIWLWRLRKQNRFAPKMVLFMNVMFSAACCWAIFCNSLVVRASFDEYVPVHRDIKNSNIVLAGFTATNLILGLAFIAFIYAKKIK